MTRLKAILSGAALALAIVFGGGTASATDVPPAACNTLTDLSVVASKCSGWYSGNLLNNGHKGADVDAQIAALSAIGLNWDGNWDTVDLTKVEASGAGKNVFDFSGVLNGDVWIGIFKGNGGKGGFSGTAFYRLTASDLDSVSLKLNGASSAVVYSQQSAVPEPGTWVTLLLGFVALGFTLRRQVKRRNVEALRAIPN